MVNVLDSEREIREAEARGCERQVRDAVMKRRIQALGSSLAVVLVIGAIARVVFWVVGLHRQ